MQFSVRQLIQSGIYAAIYFILVTISGLICVFLIPGYSYVYIPIVSAFLSGSIYMLTALRVKSFGAITFLSFIVGLFFLLSGIFPNAFLPAIFFGLMADLIAKWGDYHQKSKLLLSYCVFAYSNIGPIVPMMLQPDAYAEQLAERGKDIDYIQTAFSSLIEHTWIIVIIGTFIAALVGGYFGLKIIIKHFRNAGLIE